MILRLISIGILSLSFFTSLSQAFEAGFSVETNFVSLRGEESTMPLIADSDDDWYGVTFRATNWSARSPFGGNFYWHSRLHSIPIFFGMGFSYSLYQTSFSGYSDYTNSFYEDTYGTYDDYNASQGGNASQSSYQSYIDSKRPMHQSDFKMSVDHNIYALTLNLGYKLNTFKTLRPYYMFSAYLSPDIVSKVTYAEVGHEGYELLPNFDFETSVDIRLQFRQTIGVEWRQLKFYTAFTSGREELTYSDPEGSFRYQTALPFKKRFTYTLGMSYRFQKGIAKPVQIGQGGVSSNSKVYQFKQRTAKFFEFGITGRVNTLLSMGGNESEGDGMSLLQLDHESEAISSSTTKETVTVNISDVYTNTMDVRGVGTFGLYAKVKTKFVDLEVLGNLTPLRINMDLEDYTASIYRYVTPNGPGNYYYNQDSWGYDNEKTMEFYYNRLSVNPNLVVKIGKIFNYFGGSKEPTPGHNITLYFGLEQSFYQMKSKFNTTGNTNNLQVNKDLHTVYTEGDAAFGDTYVRFDQEISYYDDDILAFGSAPEETFESMDSFRSTSVANPLTSMGYNFGVGYVWRKLDVRIGGGFAKNWSTKSIYGSYDSFMDISIHYMLLGW